MATDSHTLTLGVSSGDHTQSPAEPDFAAELAARRHAQAISQATLGGRMGYDRSYVSKVETGGEQPSPDFAARADEALGARGALVRCWKTQHAGRGQQRHPGGPDMEGSGETGLQVQHDEAELFYDVGERVYRPTMRRTLRNSGTEPVTRYLIRISVDRHPGNPELSNQLYRDDPLTWQELDLRAWHGQHRDRREINWVAQHDRDAFKEVWLLFEGDDGHYPLYPGQTATIEYTYTVAAHKWGPWFRRAVRLPTRRLSVSLNFPSNLDPVVWGLHTSMTSQSTPFPTAIQRAETAEGRSVFSWSTQDPPLHGRYRLEWHFRHGEDAPAGLRPSETMTALGVVQDSDPALREATVPFDLPAEAEDVCRLVDELRAAMERVAAAHTFGKGMGIAAPQIGVARSVAIVQTPTGDLITLLNPRVIESSDEYDTQYEGCLSFFDVRGRIPRPLTVRVEHQDTDGTRHLTQFERGVSRLVQHEIDHLHGMLYTDRMPDGAALIPVEQYRGTGDNWQYPPSH